jgi:hypothetical protein
MTSGLPPGTVISHTQCPATTIRRNLNEVPLSECLLAINLLSRYRTRLPLIRRQSRPTAGWDYQCTVITSSPDESAARNL